MDYRKRGDGCIDISKRDADAYEHKKFEIESVIIEADEHLSKKKGKYRKKRAPFYQISKETCTKIYFIEENVHLLKNIERNRYHLNIYRKKQAPFLRLSKKTAPKFHVTNFVKSIIINR